MEYRWRSGGVGLNCTGVWTTCLHIDFLISGNNHKEVGKNHNNVGSNRNNVGNHHEHLVGCHESNVECVWSQHINSYGVNRNGVDNNPNNVGNNHLNSDGVNHSNNVGKCGQFLVSHHTHVRHIAWINDEDVWEILRMGKLTTKYPTTEFKGRRKNSSLKVKYTQENERLLEEFLAAREELKAQFEKEKGEIISNYERRNKYLRNLLEEYSEKIDMLKLNLEAEKEENKILQEKVDVMMNKKNVKNNVDGKRTADADTLNAVLFLDHYKNGTLDLKDGESKITSYIQPSSETSDVDCRSDVSSTRKHPDDVDSIRKNSDSKSDVSSISKTYSSTTTISKYSDALSLRSESTTPTPCMPPTTYIGIHATCREEFARLLEEIKVQKSKHEEQLHSQKRSMRIEFERERLQIEQCVFKQLNNKLEKEFKRRELLMNERSCLHHCLSNTIVEATLNHNPNTTTTTSNAKKLIPYDTTWAETNSDSGADVGDNRSDDDDHVAGDEDSVRSRDLRSEKSTNTCNNFINDLLCNTVIGDILREQKKRLTNEFQRQFDVEKTHWKTLTASLNANIANLVNENDWLKKQVACSGNFFDDLSSFQSDIKQKLASLKYLLDEDPYAC